MALERSSTTRVLFIGDSITDCGQREDPERIGHGYVRLIRDYLLASQPASAPVILNRGISGNHVVDLQTRWQPDVLDLIPDILSIKIGINDVWHGLGGQNRGTDIEKFEMVYNDLLLQVATLLPQCQIVLCEPSVIWPPQPIEGNDKLQPYIAVVRELAATFNAVCTVPLHGVFENAKRTRPEIDWAPDGVHPSSSGHMLIAHAWLRATGWL
jgi:acyl-CoA thioesterase I